jgi:hypothetical protein
VLVNIADSVWVGDDDGSLPRPEVVIGSVVSESGLLPDPVSLSRLIAMIQTCEDEGFAVLAKVEVL